MSFKINKINHFELTVTNLDKSKRFYEKLPGFKEVAKYDDFVMFKAGEFKLGITSHAGSAKDKFDEFRTGLDHISFEVEKDDDLKSALDFFEGKRIPHGEIRSLSNGALVLAFRDPDNIQLELCWRKNDK